jgi:hypothetical protein
MTGGPECAATGLGHHGHCNDIPRPPAIASVEVAT